MVIEAELTARRGQDDAVIRNRQCQITEVVIRRTWLITARNDEKLTDFTGVY